MQDFSHLQSYRDFPSKQLPFGWAMRYVEATNGLPLQGVAINLLLVKESHFCSYFFGFFGKDTTDGRTLANQSIIVDPSISDRMFVHQVVIAALLNHESNCQGSINRLVRGGVTDPLVGCPKDLVKEFVIHFCRKPGLDLRYFGLIISSWLEIA